MFALREHGNKIFCAPTLVCIENLSNRRNVRDVTDGYIDSNCNSHDCDDDDAADNDDDDRVNNEMEMGPSATIWVTLCTCERIF